MRAKDVCHCGVGAYAFYLVLRLFMTDEFKDCPPDFFCKNSNWFDIKLLVDCYAEDYRKEMSNDSYSKWMQRIMTAVGIISNHIIHLGRIMGSAELELLENEHQGTLHMGNWSAGVHERSYSIKLPILTMRRAAGHVLANGMHHNIWTTVEPDRIDSDLVDCVFPFVKPCLEKVIEAKSRSDSQSHLNTAVCFLELLQHLALVFLQDAAAMMILHEERKEMALFKHIPILQGAKFARFKQKMRQSLANDDNPLDYTLEAVLPGMHQRFHSMEDI
jgi:hypothetical protein